MKKLIKTIFIISVLLFTACILISCNKANGKAGNLTWKVRNNTLTVSGQGPIPNTFGNSWNKKKEIYDVNNIIISEGITHIGSNAFSYYKNAVSVSIPNTVNSIGESAFEDCFGLISIIIPDSVISIGANAFKNCSDLKYIKISNSVINIDEYAFYNCKNILTIEIPDSVISIGNYAFGNCSSLINLVLGKNLQVIYDAAFDGCRNIKTIISNNIVPPALKIKIEKSSFNYVDEKQDAYLTVFVFSYDTFKNSILTVPDECISLYKKDKIWGRFFDDEKTFNVWREKNERFHIPDSAYKFIEEKYGKND